MSCPKKKWSWVAEQSRQWFSSCCLLTEHECSPEKEMITVPGVPASTGVAGRGDLEGASGDLAAAGVNLREVGYGPEPHVTAMNVRPQPLEFEDLLFIFVRAFFVLC